MAFVGQGQPAPPLRCVGDKRLSADSLRGRPSTGCSLALDSNPKTASPTGCRDESRRVSDDRRSHRARPARLRTSRDDWHVAAALDASLDTIVRWHGGDLGRLVNARHAAMHEAMAAVFAGLDGLVSEPEVSFSIYGERGVIDVLAWHPVRQILLIIELKTELVDINDLMGSADRRRRLAATIARDRGWDPTAIATWVVLAESRTNRRAVAAHSTVLRAKFPFDGRAMRRWLRNPDGRIDALGFLPSVHGVSVGRAGAPVRRVSGPPLNRPRAPRGGVCSANGGRNGRIEPKSSRRRITWTDDETGDVAAAVAGRRRRPATRARGTADYGPANRTEGTGRLCSRGDR